MSELGQLLRSRLLESWLEFNEAVAAHPEIRKLLFDPVTGLPTTPLLLPRIESLLEEYGEISFLALNVVKYSRIEEIYGWAVFDDVMREVALALDRITGRELRDCDIVAELMVSGNTFVVLLSPPRTTRCMVMDNLRHLGDRVQMTIREELAGRLEPGVFHKFGCYVGCATVQAEDNMRPERLVHKAIETALIDSDTREECDADCRAKRLKAIIDEGSIRTLVHPVLRLSDLTIIGYEALSRGPAADEFEWPEKLFRVAYDADLVIQLERLCRRRAFEVARDLPKGRLLFINIEPDAVGDPELRGLMLETLLASAGVTPRDIVLEITERSAITDFGTFRAMLEYLRVPGFNVGIDDGGAGYASLQCLAELRPEWLKIDRSLIAEVDTDDVRRTLVASMAQFAERADVLLIAEGIERQSQLDVLREIGVEYGQGFLFGEPAEPFPVDADVVAGR